MSAPQVAFIDLATYGELESYLYGRPSIKDYNDMYPRSIKQTLTIPVVILIIFFLIYIKG